MMEREKYEAIIKNVIWLQKYLRFQVLNKIQNSAVVSGDTFQPKGSGLEKLNFL